MALFIGASPDNLITHPAEEIIQFLQEIFQSSFHVFSLQWDSTKMDILLDDAVYKTVYKTDMGSTYYSIFEKPFFFVFNVAVGGSWPGNPNSSTSFPQRMIVDYVRIYQ